MELSTLVERVAAEALLFAVEDCKGGELGLMRLVESLGLGLLLWSIEDVPIDEMELTKGSSDRLERNCSLRKIG